MLSFTAGVVLLLNVWGGKRAGLLTDYSKEMTEVHKCMNALKRCEKQCVHLLPFRYRLC